MRAEIRYHHTLLDIDFPDTSRVYRSSYEPPAAVESELALQAIRNPICSESLVDSIKKKPRSNVMIAVSDITRPIPYRKFLPVLLDEIESTGIDRKHITLLIATGMHRPSTKEERAFMFGDDIAGRYKILDHDAEGDMVSIAGTSYSGAPIKLNRDFAQADYKIVIGLVEPHFMAGFSGGRKTLCPGLSSPETIQHFHGYEFLSHPKAGIAMLEGNPCHEEALSVAKLACVDFSLQLVVNHEKRIVKAFGGDLFETHHQACNYVKGKACPIVEAEADVVLTGCGGYPLDATFYQCTKALVTALPCVKKGGTIIAVGGCVEGVGSQAYENMLRKYRNDFPRFIRDISKATDIVKDQWQIQMQARVYEKTGLDNLYFFSHGIASGADAFLGAKIMEAGSERITGELQKTVDNLARQGCSFVVIPEGPYCAPLSKELV
ncbi:MAG: nickel-dependent lactate racemase [Smithellaceae bacterium]|nr:nickel-dependent lactate racemase [Smithellaceae bacterium]